MDRNRDTNKDKLVGKRNYERDWLAPTKKDETKEKNRKYNSEFLYSIYPDGEGPDT